MSSPVSGPVSGGHDSGDAVRLAKALAAIRSLRARVEELERGGAQPIAVVGMACRFPSAPDPAAYWRLLSEGGDAIGDMPPGRWDVAAYYDPAPGTAGRMYCRQGGFLGDIAGFDAAFFGISPREAKRLDPQQRLLLEVSWEALEDAGYGPRSLEGSRAGVFTGISEAEYLHLVRRAGLPAEMRDLTGTSLSLASGRLSYHLGLRGPSLALDTACSSALVAVHLAVTSLRNGETDLALAGGASLMLAPEAFVAFSDGRALAADGRCKAFDARADGYGRGEGAGVVVLKRLRDALADADPIHAVILGTAVNQDGRTNGLTAPSGLAQQEVIRRALADAGISPAQVGYVEAHGTGTQLGDPVEASALGAVFADRGAAGPLLTGTAKTNIGHLEAAAGIAGLIKAVLAVRHRQVPPSLHFHQPNPHIPWRDLPLTVPAQAREWPAAAPAAGVSSFGFSGTNAHVVLTAAPTPAPVPGPAAPAVTALTGPAPDRPVHLLTLSARTQAALRELAGRYEAALAGEPGISLADLCYTAATGRTHFEHRLAVPAASPAEAAKTLAAVAAGRRTAAPSGQAGDPPRVAFLFPGQGSQYPGMGAGVFQAHPGFRAALEQCAEILRGHGFLDAPLTEVLYPRPGSPADGLIDRTSHAQPAIFAVEYALAQLWRSWGVLPDVVLGHSTGEYAAACVAGAAGLEDALTLVAYRARLIEEATSGGATAAVLAAPGEAAPELAASAGQVSVAGVNGPRETLIAGPAAAVTEVMAGLKARGVDARLLKVPHAPHSPMIDPVLAEFEAAASRVSFASPRIRMISNVTGGVLGAVDAHYWRRHLREPVRFSEGVATLEGEGCTVVLEAGAQPVLQLLARQNWQGPPVRWLSSLWEGRDDWKQLLSSLGGLYAGGADVDWAGFDRPYPRRRLHAPTYPFQRTRYWFTEEETVPQPEQSPAASEVSRQEVILADLAERVGASLEMPPQQVGADATFVGMGADSLMLMRLIQDMTEVYGVTLGIGRLFSDLDTPKAVAVHLDQALPPSQQVRAQPVPGQPVPSQNGPGQAALEQSAPGQAAPEQPAPGQAAPGRTAPGQTAPAAGAAAPAASMAAVGGTPDELRSLMAAQLEIMSRQLQILTGAGANTSAPSATSTSSPSAIATHNATLTPGTTSSPSATPTPSPSTAPTPTPSPAHTPALGPVTAPPSSPAPTSVPTLTSASTPSSTTAPTPAPMITPGPITTPVPVTTPGRGTAPTAVPAALAAPPAELTGRQRHHLSELLARYQELTRGSLLRAQRHRGQRADTRMRSVRPETRPVSYPLAAERASGARFWDVDGNEYVDLAMGMGVLLCGHNPDVVTAAIAEQLALGLQSGPVCALGDEVAQLACELTGMERLFFAVTGTDAVRGALRVAQAATGRSRFAMFSGSYHGQDDRVLAVPDVLGDPTRSVPMAPGISPQAAGDPLILSYGATSSLDALERHAHELAGVLVEPVQSRNPALQPAGFLRELRTLTSRLGIPLIFDEVITGFRAHPGGAQAYFGVRADIAAYGKVVGGGMPVSIVAGKAEYLDWVDGGQWADGPGPDPESGKTYIGSTFEMHPLTMAGAKAMLLHLRDRGPALQETLNSRTASLASTLDALFEAEQVPIRVPHFSSMFRFTWKGNASYAYQPLEIEVFHFHLLTRGIYLWEGRTCFLSTAHTDADIEAVVAAVRDSVAAMRAGGFLPERTTAAGGTTPGAAGAAAGAAGTASAGTGESAGGAGTPEAGATSGTAATPGPAPAPAVTAPLGEEQGALLAFERGRDPGAPSWTVAEDVLLRGPLDLAALGRAATSLARRHEALRTVFPADGEAVITPEPGLTVGLADLTGDVGAHADAVTRWWQSALAEPFGLGTGPLLRVWVLKLSEDTHHLALLAHHAVCDGWTMLLLVQELAALYSAEAGGSPAALAEPLQYRDFTAWQEQRRGQWAREARYWRELFPDGVPSTTLPAGQTAPGASRHLGGRVITTLGPRLCRALKRAGQAHQATFFMTLLAAYGLLIHRLTGQDDIVIGVPQSGRSFPGSESVAGFCAHFLPIRSRLPDGQTVSGYLRQVRQSMLDAFEHQEIPFARLREELGAPSDPAGYPLPLRVVFNLDRAAPCPPFAGLTSEFHPVTGLFTLVGLWLDAIECDGDTRLSWDYDAGLFEEATVRSWCAHYLSLLEEMARDPSQPAAQLLAGAQRIRTGNAP